jgi:peptide/nickel transport system permease protein
VVQCDRTGGAEESELRNYFFRRVVQVLPLLVGISFLSFVVVLSAPGDPVATMFPLEQLAMLDREAMREKLGLNDPIPVMYAKMMWSFVNGDLKSFQQRRSTVEMVLERLPTTILFSSLALGVALVLGIPIAVLSATRPYSLLDNLAIVGSLVGLSLPNFWFALVLMLFLSERLRLLPPTGMGPVGVEHVTLLQRLPYYIMPTTVLALGILPGLVRYVRSSMLDVLAQDYIRTAHGKGLTERAVIVRHALKNALIPVVSFLGIIAPYLLGGSVVVESVFALPGLGRLAVNAANNRDYPLVLTVNMLMAFLVVVSNLIADMGYSLLDPRIRQG